MKRYYYELMDEDYNSYEAAIPDGRIKARAIAQAKRAMRDLGIRRALLAVNSMMTSNILDIITDWNNFNFSGEKFFNWTFFSYFYTTLNN